VGIDSLTVFTADETDLPCRGQGEESRYCEKSQMHCRRSSNCGWVLLTVRSSFEDGNDVVGWNLENPNYRLKQYLYPSSSPSSCIVQCLEYVSMVSLTQEENTTSLSMNILIPPTTFVKSRLYSTVGGTNPGYTSTYPRFDLLVFELQILIKR
jgi:hypothetical protein